METIQNNNTCNPMKRKLIPGLHLAMITNPSGGCGGSLFAWETYSTCISMGIPAILATFDHWHIYPEIGPALRRLSVPETSPQYHDTPPLLEDLADVCNEARANNLFLIIDFKAGFSSDSSVLEVLKRSGIRDAASKAGLVPIQPGYPGASAISVEAFLETGIYFDRGLFRYWEFTRHPIAPRIPKNSNFPLWNASWLSDGAVTLIHHGLRRPGQPTIHHLPDLLTPPVSPSISAFIRRMVEEAVDHMEAAKKAIYQAILAPITTQTP
jgi:hypothetical protein